MDEDLVLALRLQEEWNLQVSGRAAAQEPLSLVDASWELVDPTPDLQALFVQFNDRFFWGQLEAVEVKWSMRMTLCAGVCSYEGRGGMCSIRLSEPLLKLRPRKDLVETLLHEMIHAYLFVTNNDKDREGHGPEFCKHMHRINRLTGANITVHHAFHDEVDEYRRHWWRCDGPCQLRKPFYGYVKRATNRAPSAHDHWWAEHQKSCGGTYVKVKEPESYSQKRKGKAGAGGRPAAGGKDKASRGETQPLVPFGGNGYVLGATGQAVPPGEVATPRATRKAQDSSRHDRSANTARPGSKTEAKFVQNGSSKKTLVPPVLSSGHQSVLSNYFPRASSAPSAKALRGVDGPPAASAALGDGGKHPAPSGSQRRASASKVAPRNSTRAAASASVAAPQDASRPESEVPGKRPRLEGEAVGASGFVRERAQSDGDPASASPAAPAQGSSGQPGQSEVVRCPVCRGQVLASQINEHLDRCLEGESTSVRRRKNL
ncbi:DNA-dependent metalloprotease SPRTN isoform X1 [Pteropus medius]|uniref:DNA-dependent metalloprotease SPRTN isoform X1 n=2 Tax=Pteropus vampyrus TaxID=132908 RepID=UPI00196ADCEF|nr:DNA-dependent metalloprotease SPRTN isoform X1 [Pteropus giganteus]